MFEGGLYEARELVINVDPHGCGTSGVSTVSTDLILSVCGGRVGEEVPFYTLGSICDETTEEAGFLEGRLSHGVRS